MAGDRCAVVFAAMAGGYAASVQYDNVQGDCAAVADGGYFIYSNDGASWGGYGHCSDMFFRLIGTVSSTGRNEVETVTLSAVGVRVTATAGDEVRTFDTEVSLPNR